MTMNALNGDWSDIYIPQILIHQELEKLTKCLKVNQVLRKSNFPSKFSSWKKTFTLLFARLIVQRKHEKFMLMIHLKLMVIKRLKCAKECEYVIF